MRVPTGVSGSIEFDMLRAKVAADRQLRNDIEAFLLLSIETYNPSDRGIRFVTGAIGEWMLALASYSAGVLTMPAGHNANGFDLQDLLSQARGMWSAKSSYRRGGDFIISNGRDGAGNGFIEPTIFWSPDLPGFVFAHPTLHPHMVAAQKVKKDSTIIAKAVIKRHADEHPECVIDCLIPENQGAGSKDPAFEAVKLLVEGGNFPRLKKMFSDAARVDSSIVAQLRELQAMRTRGDLTSESYEAAVRQVTGG